MHNSIIYSLDIESDNIEASFLHQCSGCLRINKGHKSCLTEDCSYHVSSGEYFPIPWPCMNAEQALHHLQFSFKADRRTEIVVIFTAVLIEALEFDLLKTGINYMKNGKEKEVLEDKLQRLTSREELIELFVQVFSKNCMQMASNVLSNKQSTINWKTFKQDYKKMSGWRNAIVHEGLFIEQHGATVPPQEERVYVADEIRKATIKFVPEVLTTFALIWNDFLHKPYWKARCVTSH